MMPDFVPGPVLRDSLASRVHADLRTSLLHGRLRPGQRLKIRELAAAMDVSETPVREAVMQLVREGGLEMRTGTAIRVAHLSLVDYLELRDIRLLLEGMAGEAAARRATPEAIAALAAHHQRLVDAEAVGAWPVALEANYHFHHGLWSMAGKPNLVRILEGIWLRNGPLVTLQYPNALPSYPGRHQHLNVLDGLAARRPAQVRRAIRDDLIQGGRNLVRLLQQMETARIVPLDAARADVKRPERNQGRHSR
jgi:DNA-binding GntR family transcriptional regulator